MPTTKTRARALLYFAAALVAVGAVFFYVRHRLIQETLRGDPMGRARLGLVRIAYALETHFDDNGSYPETLDALVEQETLDEEHLRDPWGGLVVYEPVIDPSEKVPYDYRLLSAGPDRLYSTGDDIEKESRLQRELRRRGAGEPALAE